MLQNTSKTIGFQKIMVYKTPPGGGGKPYLARGLDGMKIGYRCGLCKSGIDERNE